MNSDEHLPQAAPGPVRVPGEVELIDHRLPPGAERVASRPARPPQLRSRRRLVLFLFLATCVSVFLVGMNPGGGLDGFIKLLLLILQGGSPREMAALLLNGVIYATAVLAILMAHEMGHYLQARRYHVPATLPYFIPFPISPFGTMGAVIVQGAGVADRKVLFDIAISGPLAGLVLALPITWIGVQQATFAQVPAGYPGPIFGEPLLLTWMFDWLRGTRPEGFEVLLNPMLFAGWVGIFITALNLIPIGQLDGGHILYTLIGRRAHAVAMLLLLGAVGYMIYSEYYAYGLMVALLWMMGPRHPPTADDTVPLGTFRIFLGWLTLGFIVIGFTPMPIR